MSREARETFVAFAKRWSWPGNFRDFNASVTRMATLATGGRITGEIVTDEIARIEELAVPPAATDDLVGVVLGPERASHLDRFDRAQLAEVLAVCRSAKSLSAAGRELFASSRATKKSTNDADRLRKYLGRFELDFAELRAR